MAFDVFIYMREFRRSLQSPHGTVEGKNAKEAFNKARKLHPQVHSSRIRVERKNDPTSH